MLVRTGTGRYWGEEGADHAKIAEHDSAGPDLEATKWLVEDQGAMMVGSDTSGFEVNPPPGNPGTGIPVHRYLLVDQGVHIGEFHYLEGLSKAKAYTFCYIASTGKIKGTVAGFACGRSPCGERGGPRSPGHITAASPLQSGESPAKITIY